MAQYKFPIRKGIAVESGVSAVENLPAPIVVYPGHYGTFIGFQEHADGPILFCSCAFEAIRNYVKLRLRSTLLANADPTKAFLISSSDFPRPLVRSLMDSDGPEQETVVDRFHFRDQLCHECNQAVPSLRWCHEMYAGVFKQTYGWYIQKQGYEWGIESEVSFLEEACPDEVLAFLTDPEVLGMRQAARELWTTGKAQELTKLLKVTAKHDRKVWRLIENEVRRKFGHRAVGEAWTSETILYFMLTKLYPDQVIHRHYRPDFMEGLELDVFLESCRIAVEYQGIQHFKAVGHWGGPAALERTKQRDARKAELCKELGINLVYFMHDEQLSEELVRDRLDKHLG